MMTGPERRTAIINQIKTSSAPVPGKALAAQYEVSRQVIVAGYRTHPVPQDMTLYLQTEDIFCTNHI